MDTLDTNRSNVSSVSSIHYYQKSFYKALKGN